MMRRAFASLFMRDAKRGFLSWAAAAAELAAKRRRVAATLATISPEGRAKRKALNSLIEFYEERVRMRRAGARLFHSSLSRGFNAWLSCADPLDGTRAHFKTSHLRTRNAGTSTSRRGSRRCFAARSFPDVSPACARSQLGGITQSTTRVTSQ